MRSPPVALAVPAVATPPVRDVPYLKSTGQSDRHPACSGGIVVNPGLKSDRDRRRCLNALRGKVAGADHDKNLAHGRDNSPKCRKKILSALCQPGVKTLPITSG
jgi:hypothetical protein